MENWVLRKLYRHTPTQDPIASEQQNWDSNPGFWYQAWTLSALLSSFMWELKCLHWFGVWRQTDRRQSVSSYTSARATWTIYWLILHVSFFFFFFLVLAILLVSCLFSCFTQCATVVVQLLSCIQLWPHGLQHPRFLCPLLSSGACSTSWPLSQWCYLTISSSSAPFSFCLQSCPVSGSFPVNRLFVSVGQNIGASASAAVLPVNIQGWFPLGLTVYLPTVMMGKWLEMINQLYNFI